MMGTEQTGSDGQHEPDPAQNRRGLEFYGYTEAELLERYPQLRTMTPRQRLRKMVRYAWTDRECEEFLKSFGKPADGPS